MKHLPAFSATPSQHARAVHLVQSYISSTTQSTDARPRAHALYAFHPPRTAVHGTVVLFHGLASTPEIMRPTMTYFHNAGFNVYTPPGAGHAFAAHRLPYTLLKPEIGDKAREVILSDHVLADYFQRITTAAAMEPPHAEEYAQIIARIKARLRDQLSSADFETVICALYALSGNTYRPGLESEIARYCESDYSRYESHPFERVADVAPLPGPISVVGYSLGAVQAINLVARAKFIHKLVLLAPFVGLRSQPTGIDLAALGALELFTLPFPISTISARHFAATSVAARMVHRAEIVAPIRRNVTTFCATAELDEYCDPKGVTEYCQRELGNEQTKLFVYPKHTGLGHGIHPHSENKLAVPLLQEMLRFIQNGEVQLNKLLCVTGDEELPAVDSKSLQIIL
ncbi:unnamed protein product [Chondrus crispus]|uniref:Serine aminopeptidase S33 domain-containing protein n=1 Tax=Chondrus crispus TaxID=2769 RepID=R7QI48_CHOCR|nr:unnamed protein product [Chondrus crispus]CDF38192.1 unnamed protein product [Chondrus crispus]|eukprot:XP_005718061.1 unnamed protein product [Chondrus crispus]